MEQGRCNYKPAKTAELTGLVKKALEAVLPMLVVLQRAKAQVTGFIDKAADNGALIKFRLYEGLSTRKPLLKGSQNSCLRFATSLRRHRKHMEEGNLPRLENTVCIT